MRLIYPLSGDPFHLGHLSITRRAIQMGNTVTIALGINPDKPNGLLTPDERVGVVRETLRSDSALFNCLDDLITVVTYTSSTVDLVKKYQKDYCPVLLRGIRSGSDADNEMTMALFHQRHGIQTIFLPADREYQDVSSSIIRECLRFGLDISAFVVPDMVEFLYEKWREKQRA